MWKDYTLKRSNRKTLAIQITREGEVLVRAPQRLPVKEIEAFVASRADWIRKHRAAQLAHLAACPEPTAEAAAALQAAAQALLPQRVAFWGARMGLQPAGIRITSARTRFGSCSARDTLCFSWRLMQYPPEAIDYVVVHELAHIKHKNHGPAFYALVERILPDHKRRRQLLKAPPDTKTAYWEG